nr:60S acidic ribosomal protein P2B-like [Tanacetum cinerariifolium]
MDLLKERRGIAALREAKYKHQTKKYYNLKGTPVVTRGYPASRSILSPSAEDLKTILGSVGADADEDRIELLLKEVKGKDITELIASGREKLASVPSGGGGVAVAASAGGGAAPAAAAAESKKEEKVEEKEESDDDMGFSLFD